MAGLNTAIGAGVHLDAARQCGPIGGFLALHSAVRAAGSSGLPGGRSA
jgi:hypothetical protein